jgi:FkbM family methyltransferase
MLAKKFFRRRQFTMMRLPSLARIYQRAFCSDKMRSWPSRVLRLFFPIYYRLCRFSEGEFDYERLGRHFTIRFNGRNLQFQALYSPFFRNGYEPEVAMLIDALLPEGGVFFDIGSNWGYFSLYAASTHERLTVHSFEAMPGTYDDLVSCVEQAGLSQMITCHRIALSNADGQAFIQIDDGLHSGQATVSTTSGTKRIETRRLDAMNLPPPDFIKMDVEEHEIEVLCGSAQMLCSKRPFIVFENKPNEIMPEKALEPLFFLKQLGYELFAPVLQRTQNGQSYCQHAGLCSPVPDDLLVLIKLEPETRLLWQRDLNVLACHQSRLPQLASIFKLNS